MLPRTDGGKMTHSECAEACADKEMAMPCLGSKHQSDLLLAAIFAEGTKWKVTADDAWLGYSSVWQSDFNVSKTLESVSRSRV